MLLNVFYCAFPHVHVFFVLNRSQRGWVYFVRWGRYLPSWFTIQRNFVIPPVSIGSSMLLTVLTLLGSAFTQLSVKETWYSIFRIHFSHFSVTFASCSIYCASSSHVSCWACVSAYTSLSSIWHRTSSIPSRIWDILFWKCSGTNYMIKAKPHEKSDKQCDTEFASSFENTLVTSICQSVCSTEGSMCLSLLTESFSLVKSTQIHTLKFISVRLR